jgi:hypothetical protein
MAGGQDFNFVVESDLPHPWSWMLLVVGAIALAMVADGYATVSEDKANLLRQSDRLDRRTKVLKSGKQTADRKKSVVVARQDMADFPWDGLLIELELAVGDRVGVLSLDTEATARRTWLTAEARDIDDALSLLGRLRQSPLVREAHLVAHEKKRDASVPVITFTLQIDWRMG